MSAAMSAAPAPRGVLFDMDGVLVNSLPVMRLALEAAYRDVYGVRDDDPRAADFDTLFAEYRRHLGKGFPSIMRAMGLSPDLHPRFMLHSRYLAPYVHAYAGVSALLQRLARAGWLLGVATGKDRARAGELLAQLQLSEHFCLVLGYDSVAAPKPAPDMAHAFVAHTGVPAGRVVMVGDAPADLECAHRAGCRSVAALWGFSPAELLLQQAPHFAAGSPAELLAWLLALQQEAA
jgi:AHBA synthesis associated protein